MGQAIYYCHNCSKQLRDAHFDQGKAFRIGGNVACEDCVPESVRNAPRTPPKKATPPSMATPRPRASQTAIIPPKPSSKLPLIGAALGGGGVVLLIIILLSGGSPPPAPAPAPEPPRPAPKAAAAPVVAPPKVAASGPLDEARKYARENPDDLDGQIKRFEDVAFSLDATPAGAEAKKEVEALRARQREAIERDMLSLEREISGLIAAEAFADVFRVLKSAEHRQRSSQWKLAVGKRVREVEDRALIILGPIKEKAADAKSKGKTAELAVLVRRVEGWGEELFSRKLAEALEAVEAPPPPPPPTSAEAKSYLAAWEKAAATRDFAAAAAQLEKLALKEPEIVEERSKDVAGLKELAKAYAEMLAAIVNPRPQFLSLGGKSGRVLSIDLERVELSLDPSKPTVFHEWNEMPLSTIVALSKRSGISAELVARLDERLPKPAPDATREAFYQAERDWRGMSTRGKALEAYAKLASGPYAKRAKERLDGVREVYFTGTGLAFAGAFAPTHDGKLVTSAASDSWAEAEFYALPSTAYRCWALAGGCCAEAFAFHYQASGHTETDPKTKKKGSAEPGGPLASPLKPVIRGLKPAHPPNEPKTPARWEWIEIPLTKFTEGGAKKVRLITGEAGVGVAAILVSATLTKPPTDTEAAELAKKSEGTSKGSPVVLLDDFEQDPMPWGYVGGQEFPGAKGDLAVDGALALEGRRSIRLRSDFTGGGAYVGTWKVWAPPAGWDVRELRIWMKADGVSRIGIRIVDGSDQCHQKNHGLELKATGEWQEVVLKISEMVGGQHWGGANDAKWHAGFKGFGINIGNDCTPPDTKKGTLWIDSARAVLEPIP